MASRGIICCTVCGSANVRTARFHGWREAAMLLCGYYVFRCRECRTRFIQRPLPIQALLYAKCPSCLRTDLTSWDPKLYRRSRWQDLQVWLGASRLRCDACRRNFISWRPRIDP